VVAPIRCGGVPKSYSKQLLLVGDAAGHVDPLTGKRQCATGTVAKKCGANMRCFVRCDWDENSCSIVTQCVSNVCCAITD
jgi:hypothetical protein